MSVTPRALALELLLRAEAAGQYANIALDTALRREGGELPACDRALLTALFYSVIEHRITLDYIIDGASSLPAGKIEARVRTILRLALAQLLFFDRIPDHAAINEAVEMTPRRSKGFVNALLRSFCRGGKAVRYPDAASEPCRYLSVRYSVTEPLAAAFCARFGFARAESLLAAFAVTPAVTVRVNTRRYSRAAFIEKFGGEPTRSAPFGVRFPSGESLASLLAAGECFVQDEASQIAVEALDAHGAMRVIDLCAAPGSKSFGAAMALEGAGEVMSFDLHQNKLSLIERGAASLGLTNVRVGCADARKNDPVMGLFDRVIADVPCSGFGVIAKKPDLRYKSPETAAGLLPTQAAILERAARVVKPGGVIVYSTCTLLSAENEERIAAFLAAHGEFSLEPFSVGGLSCDGSVTLAPDTHGTDGFFIAKLRKKEDAS